MHNVAVRLIPAAFAFSIGILTSTAWHALHVPDDRVSEANVVLASSPEDYWHRVWEAAGMTGNADTIHLVSERLLCTNRSGVNNASITEIGNERFCKDADGTYYALDSITGEYGYFQRKIIQSHAAWALKNLGFIRSIGTAREAKRYLWIHFAHQS